MTSGIKILLIEDNPLDAEIIQRLLRKEADGNEFHLVMNKETFVRALDEYKPDVIVSDNSLPQFDASEALRITRGRSLYIPFILVTGTVSEEFAAGIIKAGADDYILKDRLIRLPTAIDAALKKRKTEIERARVEEELKKS
ncbi:MAG: response regulator, partial [Chitinophagaceae bacterium]